MVWSEIGLDGERMNELKRCPFCGGEAVFWRLSEKTGNEYTDYVFVRCKACYASTRNIEFNASVHKNDSEYDEAERLWNARKPMERILERLEEKAEKAMDNSEKAAELGQAYEKHMIFNGAKGNAFEEAIDIVKEEGGIE